jgi:hypothetical protein
MTAKDWKKYADEFLRWEKMSRDAIDVKRCYIDIAGDLVAGILLSQIIYWHLPNKEGEIKLRVRIKGFLCLAKNRTDWWEECRITPRQYDRAIEILEKKNLVSVKNSMFQGKRTPMIRLNFPTLIEAMSKVKCGF